MKKVPPKKEDLKRIAEEHLAYEIEMLMDTGRELLIKTDRPRQIRNALIESFVVHFRCLHHFIWNSPEGFDVAACHYFDGAKRWTEVSPKESRKMEEASDRADREIVHLTHKRLGISSLEKEWDVVALTKELLHAVEVFVEEAPQEHIGTLRSKFSIHKISVENMNVSTHSGATLMDRAAFDALATQSARDVEGQR